MAVRLAEEWFAVCAGCEVAILDIGEPLIDVLKQLDVVHMPVLMDHKIHGQTGEAAAIEIPEADVGIITGGIRSDEHVKLAEEMRRKSRTLIALGTCACFGGIPALANQYVIGDLLEKVYHDSRSTDPGPVPRDGLPELTDRVRAVPEVVPVDITLPGCPPTPEMVAAALTALLEGRPFSPVTKSVCDECPTRREKKALTTLRRRLAPPEFTPGAPLSEMRCLLEQGYLCLGPVTRGGCGGAEGVSRCIRAYMPCEGCFGPVDDRSNPMVDMMGALASIGIDTKEIADRPATFHRFTGAAGLRPPRR